MKHTKYATEEERKAAIRERRRRWDRDNKDKKHEIYLRRKARLEEARQKNERDSGTLFVVSDPDPEAALLPGLALNAVELERMKYYGHFTPGTVLQAAETGQRYQVIGGVDCRQELQPLMEVFYGTKT